MKRVKGCFCGFMGALPLLAALFLVVPGNVFAARGHSFSESECSSCHQEMGRGKAWTMTFPKADISAQCVQCHNSCDNWESHSGRSGSEAKMSRALPLQGGESIDCVTCHSTHGDVGGEDAGPNVGMLRISNLKRELCLNCHRQEGERSVRVDVTVPPDNAVIHDTHVPLLGRVENLSESHIRVRVNGAAFPLKVSGGLFHTRLRMEEGINRIELTLHGETLWAGNIFRARGGDRPTYYGRTYSGHQTGSIQECMGCHEQEDGLLLADTSSAPGLCYRCHEPFNGKRYLHGPLAVGECTSCHDPHGGTGPYHLRGSEVTLCLTCHEEDEVLGHDGGRDAVAEGSCSSCHDPHQSDRKFFRREAALSIGGN